TALDGEPIVVLGEELRQLVGHDARYSFTRPGGRPSRVTGRSGLTASRSERGCRLDDREPGQAAFGPFERGAHERGGQRMRPGRTTLELGMSLRCDEERVLRLGKLDELHEEIVGRGARQHHAVLLEDLPVAVVELIAVTVTLVHDLFAVDLAYPT